MRDSLSIDDRILQLRQSVAVDLFSPSEIVDFAAIDRALDRFRSAIDLLQDAIAAGLSVSALTEVFAREPSAYRLVGRLLNLSAELVLEDGRKLSAYTSPPSSPEGAENAAQILVELGLQKVLPLDANFLHLIRVAFIADDARERRLRVDKKVRARVSKAVNAAIAAANGNSNVFSLAKPLLLKGALRPEPDYLILAHGIPRVAISATFQSYAGGRQTRELTSQYPFMAGEAHKHGIDFVLVADGKGIRDASARALTALFEAVPNAMTISQAECGSLTRAIKAIGSEASVPTLDDVAIERLIEAGLDQQFLVHAPDLPVAQERARLAIARYASAKTGLGLTLSADGSAITWRRRDTLEALVKSASYFSASASTDAFARYFNPKRPSVPAEKSNYSGRLVELTSAIFPSIFIGAIEGSASPEAIRDVSREAMQLGEGIRIAILIVSEEITKSASRLINDVQSTLPITVVVFDLNECVAYAKSSDEPLDVLQEKLLSQSDLTKLSPYVLRGVTPDHVFFGREEEEATLISTLATNSVALLGGRRIGKTSLMQHSFGRLRAADMVPFFGDCQVVRTWEDFGNLARRNWEVELQGTFKPSDLFDVVDQLRPRGAGPVVILLDEIDQLIDWDLRHRDAEVPEAFFRTCRSISQQRLAQFVFSGERTISTRIWDASSPHWNFCRPMMLRQLTKAASAALITEPLEHLGVRIEDQPAFAKAAWDRTDGHPELLQLIGDGVIGLLNERSRDDVHVTAAEVLAVSSTFEFAEQYLETYWGQATALERAISVLLQNGRITVEEIIGDLSGHQISVTDEQVISALRMLELYGIADQSSSGYTMRLTWFRSALEYYGGTRVVLERFARGVKS